MRKTIIAGRACLIGVGIAILSLFLATPAGAAPAITIGGCCAASQGFGGSSVAEYPYSSRGNPTGFEGLVSTDQNAEEGTLRESAAQVDAEVGAGEHDVVDVSPSAPAQGGGTNPIAQGLVIFLAAVLVSIGVRWIFLPSDRIPRVGSAGDRSAP